MTAAPAPPTEAALIALLGRQRAAFLREGPPRLEQRRSDLDKLAGAIRSHRDEFVSAISADFGYRSPHETSLLELTLIVEGIGYLRRNLASWMRPERRRVSLQFRPGSNRVIYQPLGVVGIMSPWNYPASLALTPLATALAAGNRAILKPSEVTPRTADLLGRLLSGVFPEDQVAVVTGDAAVGAIFSRLPFDHLLFTGSTPVGRAVMRAASDHLVPVTLELGGKSPVIVERGSPLKIAARRTAYGKLTNAGQTCIAPDYVLVAEPEVDAFVAAYTAEVARLYPDILSNPDYSSIVSDRHHQRLLDLLQDARARGGRVVEVGGSTGGRPPSHPRTMIPTVVLGATPEMKLMQEEIFGPILPIISCKTLEAAVEFVNARPRPLALYFFGPDGPGRQMVLERTTSGGVTINETLLHYGQDDIPFGGVGLSGMGAYHGREGFKTLSHAKGVFEQGRLNLTDVMRPPFSRLLDRIVGFLLR